MAVYFITGKLGAGKTLLTVAKIKEYLNAGKPVATNLDIRLDKMFSKEDKKSLIRLPDKPRGQDLVDLGCAYGDPLDADYDEKKFGLIVLDEVGVWLNSREWKDPDRKGLIDYFRHARKYRFDLFLIVQDIESVDKMIRKTICEHLVICLRSDRLKIPYLGTALRFLGFSGNFKKNHIAHVLYGDSPEGTLVDVWKYQATELYGCYLTGQIFKDDLMFKDDNSFIDMRANYSLVPAYYLTGQGVIVLHQQQLKTLQTKLADLKGEGTDMSRQHKKIDTSIPIMYKAGALLLVGGLFFAFNNPMDNKLFASEKQPEIVATANPQSTSLQLARVEQKILTLNQTKALQTNESDNNLVTNNQVTSHLVTHNQTSNNSVTNNQVQSNFITELFKNYKSRLAGYGGGRHNRFVIIEFYDQDRLVESIDMRDLRDYGFSVIKERNSVKLSDGQHHFSARSSSVSFVKGQRTSFDKSLSFTGSN